LSPEVRPADPTEQEVYTLSAEQGLDLSNRIWYVLNRREYNETTESQARPIRLPLRRPLELQEEAGWLICNITVTAEADSIGAFYGTEVIIGHIAGDDQTYWNETLIGETIGKIDTPDGLQPRRYRVPREAIRLGKMDQLRIRVTGYGGSKVIPEVLGPITLAPLAPVDVQRRMTRGKESMGRMLRQIYRLGRWKANSLELLDFFSYWDNVWIEMDQLERLLQEEKWDLMEDSLREIDRSLGVMQKLTETIGQEVLSFEQRKADLDRVAIAALEGVYAKDYNALKDRRWTPPPARPRSFSRWGEGFEDGLLPGIQTTPTFIESPDGQRIVFRVNRVVNLEVVDVNWISKTYLVRAEIELDGRKEFATFEVLQSVFYPGVLIFPKFNAYSTVIRPDNLVKFFDVVNRDGIPLKYLIRYAANPRSELGSSILLWDDGERQIPALLRISSHQRDPMSMHIAACFPGGSRRLDTRAWKNRDTAPKDLSAFPQAEYLARNLPWDVREYYRVSPDKRQVTVYDVFEYYYPPQGDKLVLVPPVLTFAIDRGYPAKIEASLIDLGIETPYGPLKGAPTRDGILKYTLPIPSIQEWVRPAIAGATDSWQPFFSRSLGAWKGVNGINGPECMYEGCFPFLLATPQLGQEIIQAVGQPARRSAMAGIRNNQWPAWIEPFSEIKTYWTAARMEGGIDVTDVDLGNALSLYAFGQYCQSWADWRAWIGNKFAAERMWTWLKSADDWGWMQCGHSRIGGGPGSGNSALAVFSGAAAFARMSQLTGDDSKAQEGAFLLARSAVALCALPYYTDWARQSGQIGADDIVVGFGEGTGYLTASLLDDPMGATSLIGNNGIFPQAMHYLLEHARAPLEAYAKEFDARFPRWTEGAYSGRITLPQLHLRALLGQSPEALQEVFLRAQGSSLEGWWMAPPVAAEVFSATSGVYLNGWGRGILEHAWMDGDVLKTQLAVYQQPLELRALLSRRPESVTRNGESIDFWTFEPKTGVFSLQADLTGRNRIDLSWEPQGERKADQP
jgi:hypothetical protein